MMEGRIDSGNAGARAWVALAALTLTVAVAPMATIAAEAARQTAPAPAMREVTDPRGRFTIGFPDGWAVRWTGNGELRLAGEGVHDAVVGIGPAGGDGSRASVIVDVRVLPYGMSASAAAADAERGLRRLPSYQSLTAGPSTVGGSPAFHRVFTHVDHGVRLFQVQMYVADGRRLYVLSGTTRTGRTQIPRDFPMLLQIIGTFRLLPQH
jgi:hypothetical protein